MKRVLLFALLFSRISGFAQQPVSSLPLTDNKIVYNGFVSVSAGKEQLFDNAQQWYKHNFESADNTLTVIKADSGKISGTGIIHVRHHEKHAEPYDIYFTIDIIVIKGSYQYKVYDIYSFEGDQKFYYSDMYNEELYPTSKPHWPKPYRQAMLDHMSDKIDNMIAGLEKYMR